MSNDVLVTVYEYDDTAKRPLSSSDCEDSVKPWHSLVFGTRFYQPHELYAYRGAGGHKHPEKGGLKVGLKWRFVRPPVKVFVKPLKNQGMASKLRVVMSQ